MTGQARFGTSSFIATPIKNPDHQIIGRVIWEKPKGLAIVDLPPTKNKSFIERTYSGMIPLPDTVKGLTRGTLHNSLGGTMQITMRLPIGSVQNKIDSDNISLLYTEPPTNPKNTLPVYKYAQGLAWGTPIFAEPPVRKSGY